MAAPFTAAGIWSPKEGSHGVPPLHECRAKTHFLNKASNADRESTDVVPVEVALALFGVKKSQKFAFSRSVTHSACGSRHLLCA